MKSPSTESAKTIRLPPQLIRALAAVVSGIPVAIRWRMSPLLMRLTSARFVNPCLWFVVRRQGLLWELSPGDYVCHGLFWDGVKDIFDTAFIRRNMRANDVVLDVGANFGYYSAMIAAWLRGNCSIHAFEPHPETYARLRRNLSRNRLDCVTAYQLALSDAPGKMGLATEPDNSGATRLVDPVTDGSSIPADCVDLDGFADAHGIAPPAFVKVDVEGHEPVFLRGAERVLSRTLPPMMIEVSPSALGRVGTSVDTLFSQLRRIGYRVFLTCSEKGIEPFGHDSFLGGWSYRNVFCFGARGQWDESVR